MTASIPTRGQIERNLTQRLQALYQEELGQRPRKVTCQFFDQKLAIVLEQITTPAEQFLVTNERQDFAEKLRLQLDAAIKPKVLSLIEEIAGVSVNTILINTDLNYAVSGIITILTSAPLIRDPETIPKAKNKKVTNADSDK
ncbi:MAG: DUF2294 domain-containing protein [Heteroscytonema crispum UTEX LB 1556]